MSRLHALSSTFGLLAAVSLAACGEAPTVPEQHDAHTSTPTVAGAGAGSSADARPSALLQAVRRETARFHSTRQALTAGFQPDDHCVESPLGGMGMHWANPGRVDPAFEPLRPEVMLYRPGPNGQPKLVAVEYIVIDVGQPAPTFDGHPFDVGGTPVPVPHWSLHVWLYQDNPSGMFTPFNPTVSCP